MLAPYRLRWQVELAFKRLKSLLGLGELPARRPELARAWLNAKLVLALLVEDAGGELLALFRSGRARGLALAAGPRRGAEPHPRDPRAAAAAPLARAGRGPMAEPGRAAAAAAEPGR